MNPLRLLSLLALSAAAVPARADFTHATAPPWRFAPGSEYAGWESFIDGHLGDNPPDQPGTTSGAALVQTLAGGQITGGGNIYNPVQASHFEIRDEVACDLRELWVQVSTWGNVLDHGSVALVYTGCDGQPVTAPSPQLTVLANYPGSLGTNEELLFRWDLAGLATPVLEYVVHFDASAAHVSLDALILDARTDCTSLEDCQLGTPYCFGDGSGSVCPCLNQGAPGHGCGNGHASGGTRLFAEGSRSIAAGDLVLRGADAVPNQPGLFFQADSRVNGGAGVAFGDGLRCAGGGVVRLQIAFPDASGDIATTIDVAARGGVAAGETKRYQLWYRDPQASPCGLNFNLSNGFEIVWTP